MQVESPEYSRLEALYMQFEGLIPITHLCNGDGIALTTFNGNKSRPIHRWFTYKEGFSSTLYPWLVSKLSLVTERPIRVLDPFCGVGTSLLSAQFSIAPVHEALLGIEVNPFVAWVAKVKANWSLYNSEIIRALIPELVTKLHSISASDDKKTPLLLSTVNNPDYFDPGKLGKLLAIRDFIESTIPLPEKDFFILGWSAVLELASNLRKDGRALRRVENRISTPVEKLLEDQWHLMFQDLLLAKGTLIPNALTPITIYNEDGRTLSSLSRATAEQFDLILYSPPYPNNIDYSEVYKVELWLNGFVDTQEKFKELRLSTLRSHPSVSFPQTNYMAALNATSWPVRLTDALISALPKDSNYTWRSRLFRGYIEDMYLSLVNQYELTKTNGHVICVIGNSVHGNSHYQYCIAADLFIASLAQIIGFDIEELVIAREFTRRGLHSTFSRESVLIFRKP